MPKTLSKATRAGWTTKPASVYSPGAEDLTPEEMDANFLALEDATTTVADAMPKTVNDKGGEVERKTITGEVDIAAADTATMELEIPVNARITACQLRVDTALETGETWNAAFTGGDTTAIAATQAVAKNTKANVFFHDIITTGAVTNIAITRSAGGNFTAKGTISAAVFYEILTAMPDL
jgi:hypothetical protein